MQLLFRSLLAATAAAYATRSPGTVPAFTSHDSNSSVVGGGVPFLDQLAQPVFLTSSISNFNSGNSSALVNSSLGFNSDVFSSRERRFSVGYSADGVFGCTGNVEADLIRARRDDIVIEDMDFSDQVLTEADFASQDVLFRNCSFDGAVLEADFLAITFENCSGVGLKFLGNITRVMVDKCDFSKADFSGENRTIEFINAVESTFNNAHFDGCRIGNGVIVNSDFSGASFRGAVFYKDGLVPRFTFGAHGLDLMGASYFKGGRIVAFNPDQWLSDRDIPPLARPIIGSGSVNGDVHRLGTPLKFELVNSGCSSLFVYEGSPGSLENIPSEWRAVFRDFLNHLNLQNGADFEIVEVPSRHPGTYPLYICLVAERTELDEDILGIAISGLAHGMNPSGVIGLNIPPNTSLEHAWGFKDKGDCSNGHGSLALAPYPLLHVLAHEFYHAGLGGFHPLDVRYLKTGEGTGDDSKLGKYCLMPESMRNDGTQLGYLGPLGLDSGSQHFYDLVAMSTVFGRNESACSGQRVDLTAIDRGLVLDFSGSDNRIDASLHPGVCILRAYPAPVIDDGINSRVDNTQGSVLIDDQGYRSFWHLEGEAAVLIGSQGQTDFYPGEGTICVRQPNSTFSYVRFQSQTNNVFLDGFVFGKDVIDLGDFNSDWVLYGAARIWDLPVETQSYFRNEIGATFSFFQYRGVDGAFRTVYFSGQDSGLREFLSDLGFERIDGGFDSQDSLVRIVAICSSAIVALVLICALLLVYRSRSRSSGRGELDFGDVELSLLSGNPSDINSID